MLKKMIKVLSIVMSVIILFAMSAYFYLVAIPEQDLLETIAAFEVASREENRSVIEKLTSADSNNPGLDPDILFLKVHFEKFEKENHILKAVFHPSLINPSDSVDTIWSIIGKRALSDGKIRTIDVVLKKKKGKWLDQQFLFPDRLDY